MPKVKPQSPEVVGDDEDDDELIIFKPDCKPHQNFKSHKYKKKKQQKASKRTSLPPQIGGSFRQNDKNQTLQCIMQSRNKSLSLNRDRRTLSGIDRNDGLICNEVTATPELSDGSPEHLIHMIYSDQTKTQSLSLASQQSIVRNGITANLSGLPTTDSKIPNGMNHQNETSPNGTSKKQPSELIRFDFLTAMKLPDRHCLDRDEYWIIEDKWKASWHRGVQVPIESDQQIDIANTVFNLKSLRSRTVHQQVGSKRDFNPNEGNSSNSPRKRTSLCERGLENANKNNKINIKTFLETHGKKTTQVDGFRIEENEWILHLYDVDSMDLFWLHELSISERVVYTPAEFERCMIALEFSTANSLRSILSHRLTYDNNVVCDVCRNPNAKIGDEMVFCDGCNLCVHQKCYGIPNIPDGEWLCATCSECLPRDTINCILCPSMTGALKPVFREAAWHGETDRSNEQTWCHLSCALWIPETYIGELSTMEPIMGVERIPTARWSLLCYLCKEKEGACIQCAVKSCLKSFHVSCAISHNLRMTSLSNLNGSTEHAVHRRSSPVKRRLNSTDGYTSEKLMSAPFIAYCEEHGNKTRRTESPRRYNKHCQKNLSTDDSRKEQRLSRHKSQSDLSTNDMSVTALSDCSDFYRYVKIDELADRLQMNRNLIKLTAEYWKKKRIQNNCNPLIANLPNSRVSEHNRWVALHQFLDFPIEIEQIDNMNVVLGLRQELELLRTLLYLTLRREKLKLQSVRLQFTQSEQLLEEPDSPLPKKKSIGKGGSNALGTQYKRKANKVNNQNKSMVSDNEPPVKRSRGRPRKSSVTPIKPEKLQPTITKQGSPKVKAKAKKKKLSSSTTTRVGNSLIIRDTNNDIALMESIKRDTELRRRITGIRCSKRTLVKYTRLNIRRFIGYNPTIATNDLVSQSQKPTFLKRAVGRPRKLSPK